MCNKLCAPSHDALDRRRCNPQARPSTCRGEIFYVRDLGQSSSRKCPYLWRYPNFLITQLRICQRKLPCQKKTSYINPVVSIQPRLMTDSWIYDNSIYGTSIASRGKKITVNRIVDFYNSVPETVCFSRNVLIFKHRIAKTDCNKFLRYA